MQRFRLLQPLAALFAVLLVACSTGPCVKVVGSDGSVRANVRVEVADTAGERQTGLMYRNHLDTDAGMIFVFSKPSHQTFWMENTEIPLDMIFADGGGRVIGIVPNAEPYSQTIRSVDGESQYVLEVNGGFAVQHGIRAGDRFVFEHFTPHAAN